MCSVGLKGSRCNQLMLISLFSQLTTIEGTVQWENKGAV
jgi:hypothetical protein